jgi:hypothetical protein
MAGCAVKIKRSRNFRSHGEEPAELFLFINDVGTLRLVEGRRWGGLGWRLWRQSRGLELGPADVQVFLEAIQL